MIGAGAVGSSLAYAAPDPRIRPQIALYDIAEKKVEAGADLLHGTQLPPPTASSAAPTSP